MALLLETTLGDLTIDLDLDGSPRLCENILKLAKARYYTQCLFYYVGKGICLSGDPSGTGNGGVCWEGLVDAQRQHNGDVTKSNKRFLSSSTGLSISPSSLGNSSKGRVIAMDIDGIPNTIGSQFLITTEEGAPFFPLPDDEADNTPKRSFLSLGTVTEDSDGVLDKLNDSVYCDKDGRPYTDIRIIRAHVLDDPFEDPPEMANMLKAKSVTLIEQQQLPSEHADCCRWIASSSPDYKKPSEEIVEVRVTADELIPMNGDNDEEIDEQTKQKIEEEARLRDAKSRAVVLEMIGDLPSADMKPPENVLFVCKLNPATEEEDLELIFSRFDNDVHVDLIRDSQTGQSLQYAFVEFTTEQQCNEAYFKMNNTLIDDRRIKVDFSQSVSKIWNKYTQQKRKNANKNNNDSLGNTNYNHHENNHYNHSRQIQTNNDESKIHNRNSIHSGHPPAGIHHMRGDPHHNKHNVKKYENMHREDYKTSRSSSHQRSSHKRRRKYSNDDDGSERKQQYDHDCDSRGSFDSRDDRRRSRSKERKHIRHRRSDDRKHRKKHHRHSHYDDHRHDVSDDSSNPRKSRKKEKEYDRKESSSGRHRKESSRSYDRKKRYHDDSDNRRERRKYKKENRKRSNRDDQPSDEKHHHRHHRTDTYSK